METTTCPNCESLMNVNDQCPECDHIDGDVLCRCDHCHEWENETCLRCGEDYDFCICRPIVCCACSKPQNQCQCSQERRCPECGGEGTLEAQQQYQLDRCEREAEATGDQLLATQTMLAAAQARIAELEQLNKCAVERGDDFEHRYNQQCEDNMDLENRVAIAEQTIPALREQVERLRNCYERARHVVYCLPWAEQKAAIYAEMKAVQNEYQAALTPDAADRASKHSVRREAC